MILIQIIVFCRLLLIKFDVTRCNLTKNYERVAGEILQTIGVTIIIVAELFSVLISAIFSHTCYLLT